MLTIDRVKELAKENYNKGGDTIVECYEDKQIEELINSGIDTEEKLFHWFRVNHEINEEYRKAALYHAYGTTDEEEIKRTNNPEIETDYNYEDDFNDPCFGCQACDNGYNCKHCIHGDDGQYSVYDVYTPSELGLSVKW